MLVVFTWVGVVAFRRFHHCSQNRPAIKDAATLVGYWGSYEASCEASYETSLEGRLEERHALHPEHAFHSQKREAAELCMRILKRLG